MDFRSCVRSHVPPLALAREPEILDELAQHLSDLYEEGRAEGLTHEAARAPVDRGRRADHGTRDRVQRGHLQRD